MLTFLVINCKGSVAYACWFGFRTIQRLCNFILKLTSIYRRHWYQKPILALGSLDYLTPKTN